MQAINFCEPLCAKNKARSAINDRIPVVTCIPDGQKDELVKCMKALRYDVLVGGDQKYSHKSAEVLLFDVNDRRSMHFVATDDRGELIGGARLVMPHLDKSLPIVHVYPDVLSKYDFDIDLAEIAQIDMYVTVKSLRRRSGDEIEGVSRSRASVLLIKQGKLSRNYLLLLNILKNMFAVAKANGVKYLVYQMSVAMQETFDALAIVYKKLLDDDKTENQSAPCLIVIDEVLGHFAQSKTIQSMWFLMR